ncbi:MAG TPA: ABC transporter permease [Acidimicrobiales bacterium]|nr:ABC transporter permease [Acidimicrobiales bacterium]
MSSRPSELTMHRELLANLTLRELRGKYKRSALGWAWSLLNPLASMLVYTIVFAVILKIDVDPGDPSDLDVFALFLLCGLLPWGFLANSMTGGTESLVGNANLIRKVWFPRQILVGATVGSFLITFLIEMGVLVVALLIAGNMVLPWLVPALLLIVVLTAFSLGIALMLAVANVYFRDMRHLIGIVLQVWFYLTPIIYPLELVPKEEELLGMDVPARDIILLNPMTRFVEAFRDLFYDLRWPTASTIAYVVAWSAASLALGWWVFRRAEGRLAEEL